QDYDAFYEQEIAYRKIMLYPPVWNMLVILCASKSEEAADAMAAELAAAADAYTGQNAGEKVYLVGPVDAAIAKVNDIYKKIIYLKAENYDTLVKIKNRTEVYARESRYYKNVTVMFDFNPVNGF
ncbi:MAG: primosomal protein N', partial [Roseburia hominis]|nr:primosomal protein N' [Roseburia hominis]